MKNITLYLMNSAAYMQRTVVGCSLGTLTYVWINFDDIVQCVL